MNQTRTKMFGFFVFRRYFFIFYLFFDIVGSCPGGGTGRHAGLTEASTRRAVKSCEPKKFVRVRFPPRAQILNVVMM
jgi:hypothetical protein